MSSTVACRALPAGSAHTAWSLMWCSGRGMRRMLGSCSSSGSSSSAPHQLQQVRAPAQERAPALALPPARVPRRQQEQLWLHTCMNR